MGPGGGHLALDDSGSMVYAGAGGSISQFFLDVSHGVLTLLHRYEVAAGPSFLRCVDLAGPSL